MGMNGTASHSCTARPVVAGAESTRKTTKTATSLMMWARLLGRQAGGRSGPAAEVPPAVLRGAGYRTRRPSMIIQRPGCWPRARWCSGP